MEIIFKIYTNEVQKKTRIASRKIPFIAAIMLMFVGYGGYEIAASTTAISSGGKFQENFKSKLVKVSDEDINKSEYLKNMKNGIKKNKLNLWEFNQIVDLLEYFLSLAQNKNVTDINCKIENLVSCV